MYQYRAHGIAVHPSFTLNMTPPFSLQVNFNHANVPLERYLDHESNQELVLGGKHDGLYYTLKITIGKCYIVAMYMGGSRREVCYSESYIIHNPDKSLPDPRVVSTYEGTSDLWLKA